MQEDGARPAHPAEREPDMRRILVTGGAGFLGSHLCDRLLADGAEVVCLDNFDTGRHANLTRLIGHPRFTLVDHDVRTAFDAEVDAIYNLASPASPPRYQSDPTGTLTTNVLGAMNMLELAAKCGARILQASTSEVYGDPEVHPQSEAYWGHVNPVGPRACYDEGKRAAETLFADHRRQFGTRVRIARIFNTYGPRMRPDDGRVISNLVTQALAGGEMTIHGDGRQTRSFCYVDDLIEALVRLMATPDDITGPVNLGNPDEIAIGDLAWRIRELAGDRARLVFRDAPPDNPRRRRPDIALARDLLGWTPGVTLDDGLRRTIAHFQSELVR